MEPVTWQRCPCMYMFCWPQPLGIQLFLAAISINKGYAMGALYVLPCADTSRCRAGGQVGDLIAGIVPVRCVGRHADDN